jgi:hypothetical protein
MNELIAARLELDAAQNHTHLADLLLRSATTRDKLRKQTGKKEIFLI